MGRGRKERVASRGQMVQAALAVLAQNCRQRPADRVMREMFRAARGLDEEARRWITSRVFAYYRWCGWLDAPNERALHRAWEMQQAFQSSEDCVSVSALRQRAIPDWVKGAMKCPPSWLRSLQRWPRLWIRARRGKAEAVRGKLPETKAWFPDHPECLEYRGSRDLYQTEGFREGLFEIQDVASQVVGWMCQPQPGQTWWDACAGAGGKTLQLSDRMENKGMIWATDRSSRRLAELKRRAKRAGAFNYRSAPWDDGQERPVRTMFDGVLVDAPCSGVGTWQRNPHARWTTRPEDVVVLAERQEALLLRAAHQVKVGGRLIYAVCTLTRAETGEVVTRVGSRLKGFRPLALRHPMQEEGADSEGDGLWLWPQETGGDGMFIAAWQRC